METRKNARVNTVFGDVETKLMVKAVTRASKIEQRRLSLLGDTGEILTIQKHKQV